MAFRQYSGDPEIGPLPRKSDHLTKSGLILESVQYVNGDIP